MSPKRTGARPGPGRPRDPEMNQRVIDAALELFTAEKWPITVTDLVNRSGVTRAAIYRRWSSLDEVLAEALDTGRAPIVVPENVDLRSALMSVYFGDPDAQSHTERSIRRRIQLSVDNPELQTRYWEAHVQRRRAPVAAALQRGVDEGLLRADLDIDSTIDLLSGVFYYQFVVRGVSLTDPEVQPRLTAAFNTIWRAILRENTPG